MLLLLHAPIPICSWDHGPKVRLAQTAAEQVVERQSIIDRLGTEIDAARRIVRPYFDR